ncbi:acyl-CoA thioesterase [Mycolicibacterium monacense]|uniref:acyl-CoA thioesterase n=1 Tax=Mycolicibacterium monacense TaxID=85693 RepID=UPI00399BDFA5
MDRPSDTTSISNSTGGPTRTTRENTAYAERTDLSGNRLATATIACASTCVPSTTCRSSAAATPVWAVNRSSPAGWASNRSSSISTVHCAAVVSASQNGKRCISVTVFTDVPSGDVIRHHLPRPAVVPPAEANDGGMPMVGRQVRLVDVVDVNSPDEVGPPELYAWLHYDPIPQRDDLAKALIAYFTGHLGISTTMRAHEGIGTAQAHLTVSTAPMTISVSFHEPVRWDGWLLYSHESTQVGAGMSYVRGAVHTEEGELIASFSQDALIRPLRTTDNSIATQNRL